MAPVKFMFERCGRVAVSIPESHTADLMNKVLDIGIERGASEIKQSEEADPDAPLVIEVIGQRYRRRHSRSHGFFFFWVLYFQFLCQPESLGHLEGGIREDMEDIPQASIISAELVYVPREALTVEDEERQRLENMVEALEADNDTYKVYTSARL